MRLSCLKALVLSIAVAGCREGTAPPPGTTLGLYVLESISGQPLPAIKLAIPGDTIRVIRSTVTLDLAGKAAFVDDVSIVQHNSPAVESTSIYTLAFRIIGNSVAFNCVPPVDCATLPVGKISGSTLTLSGGQNPAAVLLYRLSQAY